MTDAYSLGKKGVKSESKYIKDRATGIYPYFMKREWFNWVDQSETRIFRGVDNLQLSHTKLKLYESGEQSFRIVIVADVLC